MTLVQRDGPIQNIIRCEILNSRESRPSETKAQERPTRAPAGVQNSIVFAKPVFVSAVVQLLSQIYIVFCLGFFPEL